MGKKRCQKNGKTGWPEIGDVGGEAAARVTTNAACRAGRPIYGRTALKRWVGSIATAVSSFDFCRAVRTCPERRARRRGARPGAREPQGTLLCEKRRAAGSVNMRTERPTGKKPSPDL